MRWNVRSSWIAPERSAQRTDASQAETNPENAHGKFLQTGVHPLPPIYRLTRHWPPSILKFCVMVSVLLPFLSLVVFFTVKVADGPSTTSRPLALIAAEYCSSV